MSRYPAIEQSWKDCMVSEAVLRTIVWINEAVDASSNGTKCPSLTTRFEGPYDTVQLIWNKVKSVAALYSAAMTCTQNQSRPFPTRDELAMTFSNEDDAAFSNPELLPASVRLVLSGDAHLHLPCIIGTIIEFDEECAHVSGLLGDRPREDWEAHRDAILEGVLDDPGVDYKAILTQNADYPEQRNA
jgi:hypothetical protein